MQGEESQIATMGMTLFTLLAQNEHAIPNCSLRMNKESPIQTMDIGKESPILTMDIVSEGMCDGLLLEAGMMGGAPPELEVTPVKRRKKAEQAKGRVCTICRETHCVDKSVYCAVCRTDVASCKKYAERNGTLAMYEQAAKDPDQLRELVLRFKAESMATKVGKKDTFDGLGQI